MERAEIGTSPDAWLPPTTRATRRAFSLVQPFRSGFYVGRFPVAVARVDGRIVAFATAMWTTAQKSATSPIDLMRYA